MSNRGVLANKVLQMLYIAVIGLNAVRRSIMFYIAYDWVKCSTEIMWN
jgi:hypothetical protein